MPLNLEIMQTIITALLYFLSSIGVVAILGSIIVIKGVNRNDRLSKPPGANTPSSH